MDSISVYIRRHFNKGRNFLLTSANRKRLKTAFKVWLICAILKAFVILLAWMGLATIFSQHLAIFNSLGADVQNQHQEELVKFIASSRPICHLAKRAGNLKHSLGGSTGGLTTEQLLRKAILDSRLSDKDVENFISFGKYLGELVIRVNERGEALKNNDGKRVANKDDLVVLPHIRPKVLRTLSNALGSSANMADKIKSSNPKFLGIHEGPNLHPWQKWQNAINQYQMHANDLTTDQLLHSLINEPVTEIQDHSRGTQIQLLLTLKDGTQAIFKPMRVSRNEERNPDVFFWHDLERHHAEIAGFHLDKILDFRRVFPTLGRFVNITTDIQPLAARPLADTIYISPAGNKCFYGNCDRLCDASHPVCGVPSYRDVIEGSVTAWILPGNKKIQMRRWNYPWRKPKSRNKLADWQKNHRFCDKIKSQSAYKGGRKLLDMIDISIFDYLISNQARQYYYTISAFGNDSLPILFDNGHGLGLIQTDDVSILSPLRQCCRIRHSTLHKLLRLATDDKRLSIKMRESLDHDPLSSGFHGALLSEDNLKALDRRLGHILDVVYDCVQSHGGSRVIIGDGL